MVYVVHHADEHEDQLDDISVGHGVQASQQCVDDGHGGGDPDTGGIGQIQDHGHGSSCEKWKSFTTNTHANACREKWLAKDERRT